MPGPTLLHIGLLLPVYIEAAPLKVFVQRIPAGVSYLVDPAQPKVASNSATWSVYSAQGQMTTRLAAT
jgi:hypothetical protein